MSVFKAYGHLLLLEKYKQKGIDGVIEREAYEELFKLYTHARSLKPTIEYGPPQDRQTYSLEMPPLLIGDIQTLGQRLSVDNRPVYRFWSTFYQLKDTVSKYNSYKANKIAKAEKMKTPTGPLHFKVKHCEIFIPDDSESSKKYLVNVNKQQELDKSNTSIPWCTGIQGGGNMTDHYLIRGNVRLIYIKYGQNIRDIICISINAKTNELVLNGSSTVDYHNRQIKDMDHVKSLTKLDDQDIQHILTEAQKIVIEQPKVQEEDMDEDEIGFILETNTANFIWTGEEQYWNKYPSALYVLVGNGQIAGESFDGLYTEALIAMYESESPAIQNIENKYIHELYTDVGHIDTGLTVINDNDLDGISILVKQAFAGLMIILNDQFNNNIDQFIVTFKIYDTYVHEFLSDFASKNKLQYVYDMLKSDMFNNVKNSQKYNTAYNLMVEFVKTEAEKETV